MRNTVPARLDRFLATPPLALARRAPPFPCAPLSPATAFDLVLAAALSPVTVTHSIFPSSSLPAVRSSLPLLRLVVVDEIVVNDSAVLRRKHSALVITHEVSADESSNRCCHTSGLIVESSCSASMCTYACTRHASWRWLSIASIRRMLRDLACLIALLR
jgi:hypothetical protein